MRLYQPFVRHVLYPLDKWRTSDYAEVRYLREFERTQYLPQAEIHELQRKRLQSLLEHAYANCPFHRQRMQQANFVPTDLRSLSDLEALPPLEKSDIQQNRDALVAGNWKREELITNQTGGSTGQPLSFYLSHDRKCSRLAATLRHNRWAGWDVGDKNAIIWGAPQDLVNRNGFKARVQNLLLSRTLSLDTGNITTEKMLDFYQQLRQFRPRCILAYAQAAVLFCQFLKSQGLVPPRPHSIVTSAEVLRDQDRTLVEEVFGCPVFNRYGSREVSVLASECDQHDGLHTMAEGLYIEVVDREGKATSGTGSILVTDLLNYAMPLIRYRIGDMGVWAQGKCRCGRELPRLKEIQGRITDFLVGTDNRLVSGVFLATYLLAQRPKLGQVQIRQEALGHVRYLIQSGPTGPSTDDLRFLENETRKYLGSEMNIEIEMTDHLPLTPSGKFSYCRSSVTPSFV